MKLTTRGRYAVTAMLDLAIHHAEDSVALADVSERQGISLSYLEQLLSRLRKAGLVTSTRGPGGGYCLSRSPGQISIAQIIDAIDENIDATLCAGHKNCVDDDACLTHFLWEELSVKIREFLSRKTLGDLACQPHVKEVVARQEHRFEINIAL
jgi:Rrf2 family iron-sulfur cluster assembly transcriptional regulator